MVFAAGSTASIFAAGTLYALITPPFQAPDEFQHFSG
jgi:hypothetical protein